MNQDPIFLCIFNSRRFISSFFTALERLATQSKAYFQLIFIAVKTAIDSKLFDTLEQLSHRDNRNERKMVFVEDCIVDF